MQQTVNVNLNFVVHVAKHRVHLSIGKMVNYWENDQLMDKWSVIGQMVNYWANGKLLGKW